jgi:hypothetical protein
MNKGPFLFGIVAEGENFTNREIETERLVRNFENGLNTILISPRRWGKSSLVRHAAGLIKRKDIHFCFIDLFNIRSEEEFYETFSREVVKASSGKWQQLIKDIGKVFKQLVPKFGISPDPSGELTISLDWEEVKKHPSEILNLAEAMCKARKIRMIICLDEFQNISFYNDPNSFQKQLRAHWQHHQHVNYCLYGSRRHMLMEFFTKPSMPFYKFGDIITLGKIQVKYWIPFIQQRFHVTGKSIKLSLAQEIADAMKYHPYFVQQLSQEVWYNTSKICTENNIEEAKENLLQQYHFLFQREVDQLTVPQINFLRALVEGEEKFTSLQSLKDYKLGSSGNVKRIREALENKELIDTITEKPEILDPLFELWLQKTYFKISKKKMTKKKKEVTEILCDAIKRRKLIRFYYESASSGTKDWRTVEPYIIGIKDRGAGNSFLAALPITEMLKPIEKRITGHYLINKIDVNTIEVLEDTYNKPHVERERIVNTPTINVICRFIYDDEK